ncbi:MAG: outer membrane beta-barrel protein [Flavobacteriales bacterium]
MKKREEDILKSGERNYELKQSYLDDLTNKLDSNKVLSIRKRILYLFSSLVLVGILGFLLIEKCGPNELDTQLVKVSNSISVDNPIKKTTKKNSLKSNDIDKSEANETVVSVEVKNDNGNSVTVDSKENKRLSSNSDKAGNANGFDSNKSVNSKFVKRANSKKRIASPINLTGSANKSNSNSGTLPKDFDSDKNDSSIKSRNNIGPLTDSTLKKELIIIKNSQNKSKSDTKPALVLNETKNESDEKSSTNTHSFSNSNEISDSSLGDLKDSIYSENLVDSNEIIKDTIVNNLTDSATSLNQKWKVSLLAGTNTSFSNFGSFSNQAYLEKRKEEKSLTDFAGGISISKGFGENWVVTSGLNYLTYGSNNNYSPSDFDVRNSSHSRVDSSFSNTIDSMYYLPTRAVFYYIKSVDTSYDSIYGTHKEFDSTAYNSRGKAKLSYIEIPLMIGYYKSIKKWNVGIKTGISVGLLTKQSGYFIGEDRKSILEAKSNQLMFNYIISPDIEYNLTDNYFIGFQPFFKFGLNNLSISSNEPIRRNYNSFQLSAKIGYRF